MASLNIVVQIRVPISDKDLETAGIIDNGLMLHPEKNVGILNDFLTYYTEDFFKNMLIKDHNENT